MTKRCIDCKWMREPGEFAKCIAPQNSVGQLTGFENWRYTYCKTQRDGSTPDSCSAEGRWFEATAASGPAIVTEYEKANSNPDGTSKFVTAI